MLACHAFLRWFRRNSMQNYIFSVNLQGPAVQILYNGGGLDVEHYAFLNTENMSALRSSVGAERPEKLFTHDVKTIIQSIIS